MRMDIEWLGEMLQREPDPEQLAEQLTLGGLEVESVRLSGAGAGGGPATFLTLISRQTGVIVSASWGSPERCPRWMETAWNHRRLRRFRRLWKILFR